MDSTAVYLSKPKEEAATVAEEEEADNAEDADETVKEAVEDEEEEAPQQSYVTIATDRDTNQTCARTAPRQEKHT